MAIDAKLKKLAVDVYNKNVPTNYSFEGMQDSLRKELGALVYGENGKFDFYKYNQNKWVVFELMHEVIDEILPVRIASTIGRFAEIKTYGHGDKPEFKVKKGRKNVKRFVTRVAPGGVYERVRLDSDSVPVQTYAIGGSVYASFERFLSGQENLSDLVDIFMEGMEDQIYTDVQNALKETLAKVPAANKHSANVFSGSDMRRILTSVSAYGTPTIFCTPEFAFTIEPDTGFIGDADKDDVRNRGYVGRFSGANVVVLPQSFEDEGNETKILDPTFAYIIPAGADEKIVKVGFEGSTQIKDIENADWSMELAAYRKMSMVVLHTNYYGIYKNTGLA